MNEEQLRMIGNQAACVAIDALKSGDLTIRQLADDAIALIAEVRRLKTELEKRRKLQDDAQEIAVMARRKEASAAVEIQYWQRQYAECRAAQVQP